MFSAWFFWAVCGVLCIGLELLIPGFVVFFFGVGALLVALCSLFPFVNEAVWLQLLLFVVFSVLSIVFLRKKFRDTFYGSVLEKKAGADGDDGIGEICEVVEAVSGLVPGRVRFRGTTWNAVLAPHAPSADGTKDADAGGGAFVLRAGDSARICGRNGLTYLVEPAKEP